MPQSSNWNKITVLHRTFWMLQTESSAIISAEKKRLCGQKMSVENRSRSGSA